MALGMVDIYDRAQQRTEEILADALAEHQRRAVSAAGPGLSHCADCGEPISAARRAAVAGCRRCVDCQQIFEKTGGHHG